VLAPHSKLECDCPVSSCPNFSLFGKQTVERTCKGACFIAHQREHGIACPPTANWNIETLPSLSLRVGACRGGREVGSSCILAEH